MIDPIYNALLYTRTLFHSVSLSGVLGYRVLGPGPHSQVLPPAPAVSPLEPVSPVGSPAALKPMSGRRCSPRQAHVEYVRRETETRVSSQGC